MVSKNISLKSYNTFGLDYRAENFISLRSEAEASLYLKKKRSGNKPVFILGGGSNLLFVRDFHGTIIHPEMDGIRITDQKPGYMIVSCGAGVKWDYLVEWSVAKGFGGLENLSLIPGTVGAAPVQNIGAYGSEARDTIEKVRALSISDGSPVEFSNHECRFGYRESIFKNVFRNKYLITEVFFRLQTNPSLNTVYGSLSEEAARLGNLSLQTVRQAVINIRTTKLPDPTIIGNAGSFFRNPLVSTNFTETFLRRYPQAPVYDDPSGNKKIAAGWLIDQCGWRGKRNGDAGVFEKQALVLVNHGKATGPEILGLAEEIRKSVKERFGIELENEVEIV
jgi:UDP-N-acetylmuramate dehydrogenase